VKLVEQVGVVDGSLGGPASPRKRDQARRRVPAAGKLLGVDGETCGRRNTDVYNAGKRGVRGTAILNQLSEEEEEEINWSFSSSKNCFFVVELWLINFTNHRLSSYGYDSYTRFCLTNLTLQIKYPESAR
jgi:hypothetical protein